MTELERYRATVEHRRPDRLLFHLSFTPGLEKRLRAFEGLDEKTELAAYYGAFRPVSLGLKPPPDYSEPDWSVYFQDLEIPKGSWYDRNGCLHIQGSEHHFTRYISPLRNACSWSDLNDYPWRNWSAWDSGHFADAVRAAHAEGRVVRVCCTHMYEESWQVRGYQEFLEDMLLRPEWAHYILDRFKERNRLIAVAAARAGADELYTGDDVANQITLMFSLAHWREFIKAKWAEVYAAAHAIKPDIRIWYHSDGNIGAIIPELIEIGVDILNPLQPECVDVEEVKRRWGNRIVMDGTIGTQTTMPFGTPEDVRACVARRVQTLGQDGALILSPTHVLEPEVPVENVRAFVEACKHHGRLA
ncbi:MAG: uroporphyrinogen decarboxylase family protein [Kiritimatiellia bacterium]